MGTIDDIPGRTACLPRVCHVGQPFTDEGLVWTRPLVRCICQESAPMHLLLTFPDKFPKTAALTFSSYSACLEAIHLQSAPMRLYANLLRKKIDSFHLAIIDFFQPQSDAQRVWLINSMRLVAASFFDLPNLPQSPLPLSPQSCFISPFLFATLLDIIKSCVLYH